MSGYRQYGFGARSLSLPYEDAVARVREALQSEGFGVITEIDVRETMQKKLGADFRPYVILGACNPSSAHQALQAELALGLLLPCNVIVYQEDDGRSAVEAMDPENILGMVGNPELTQIATDIKARLQRALDSLSAQPIEEGGTMKGLIKDIKEIAKKNANFRQEIETGQYTQIVVMSIPPGGEIGMEVHEDTDQALYITKGEGKVILNGEESKIEKNDIVLVHAGTWHNFINTDDEDDLKIITTYSPPHHAPGTVHATKADADAAEMAERH